MLLAAQEKEVARILAMRDTVIFAGSGLSAWSGLPTWATLIEKLIEFVECKSGSPQAAARRAFKERDFLVAADYLVRRIKTIELGEFLRADLGFANARPHRVHQIIESLGPDCFVTTNYDPLIETQFASSGRYLKRVTNRQVADFADIVRADAKDFVFKIHGSIDDAQSIVISEAQYHQTILNSTGMRSVFETVKWPAPGSEDTELGVLMELEVGHGETEVHAGVQA
jgi:hypothetical protein